MSEQWKKWLKEERKNAIEQKWDFSKFKIVCSKCNSNNVEINGENELESGYYGSVSSEGIILIKCHNCGNAMLIQIDDSWDLKGANNEKTSKDNQNTML